MTQQAQKRKYGEGNKKVDWLLSIQSYPVGSFSPCEMAREYFAKERLEQSE